MIGFLIGTACLFGLCAVARRDCRGRWRRHWQGRCDEGRFSRWRGSGRRFLLFWLSDRLDATPGQERVFAAALDRLEAARAKVQTDLREAGLAMAQKLRSDTLDRDALQNDISKAHAELVHVEEALLDAATEIHEALEPEQRRRLADLIEKGLRSTEAYGCCGREHRAA